MPPGALKKPAEDIEVHGRNAKTEHPRLRQEADWLAEEGVQLDTRLGRWSGSQI